jgi:hypothetical protein
VWQDELPIRIASGSTRRFSELSAELGESSGRDRYRRLLRATDTGDCP